MNEVIQSDLPAFLYINAMPSPSLLAPHPPHIVLIPGFMCDASLWQKMLPTLQMSGHVHHADLNEGDTIDMMADRIINTLPDHCVLIGFSLGGYVARRIARKVPARIAGLVLLNTSARASTPLELEHHQQQIRFLQRYPYKGQTRNALRRALDPDQPDNEALLDQLHAMSVHLGKEIFMRQLALIREDGHADLPHIPCPCLVIANRKDQMRTLSEAEQLTAGLTQGQLLILDEGGHMSPLEQADKVLQALDLWQTTHWNRSTTSVI